MTAGLVGEAPFIYKPVELLPSAALLKRSNFTATLLSILAARGLALAFRSVRRLAVLLALVLLVYPAVYYITHPSMAYRHPIDPVLVLLSVSAFTARASKQETYVMKADNEGVTALSEA